MNELSYLEVRLRRRWWVNPLLDVAIFLAVCGAGLKVAPIAGFIANHGFRYEVVARRDTANGPSLP